MTKPSPAVASPVAPGPLEAQADEIVALREVPEPKSLMKGEIAGLGTEALEAYGYGERMRWDSNGRKWEFTREARDTAFRLNIRVSLEGVWLCEEGLALDRIAGTDGEDALKALVERLAEDADRAQARVREIQAAMAVEGANAAKAASVRLAEEADLRRRPRGEGSAMSESPDKPVPPPEPDDEPPAKRDR